MTKADLLKTAKEIKQVDKELADEFSKKRDVLVGLMNDKMMERLDLKDMVGENNIEMMKDNHANHGRFLESLFYSYEPEVFVDTVLWVFRAYRSRSFSSTYWAAQLNTWVEIYKEQLTDQCFKAIYPYYKWMQINIPSFNMLAEKEIEAPLSSH